MCEGASSSAEIVSCVKEHTFSLEEAVLSAYKGFFLDYPEAENLTGTENWSWDLTSAWQGRLVTPIKTVFLFLYILDFDLQ